MFEVTTYNNDAKVLMKFPVSWPSAMAALIDCWERSEPNTLNFTKAQVHYLPNKSWVCITPSVRYGQPPSTEGMRVCLLMSSLSKRGN